MPGVPLVMTQRSLSANKAALRVTHGERERGSVDGGGWDGMVGAPLQQKKWCKNKKKLRGRNSKWVTMSQVSRKKGSREQPEEEERKEKLRVAVDGGQLALHPTQRFGVIGRKRCHSGGEEMTRRWLRAWPCVAQRARVQERARLKGRLHVSVSTSAFSAPPHHSVAPDAAVFLHRCGPKRAEPK